MSLNPSNDTEASSASESSKTGSKLHAGYSLEAGVLARARSWVDIFGWIRLGRVLRVAGSPILLLMVAFTTCLWLTGLNVLLGARYGIQSSPLFVSVDDTSIVARLFKDALAVTEIFRAMFLPEVFNQESPYVTLSLLARSLCSILVWSPCSMVLLRQGALLTAGRPMQPIGDVARWVLPRIRNSYLAAVIPSVGVLSMFWVVPITYWLSSIIRLEAVDWLFSLVLVCLAIPMGMLAFGSLVAIPLSWAAVINERDPDTLDSLSRGYEYLYRRPLRLLSYAVVAILILFAINTLATWVVGYAARMVAYPVDMNSGGGALSNTTVSLLRFVPVVVTYTVSWSLIGGIYLLLRHDAGGQEVEDLWIEPSQSSADLPELKQ